MTIPTMTTPARLRPRPPSPPRYDRPPRLAHRRRRRRRPCPRPHSLLVDSGEFYAAIAPAILAARRRAYLQVMTFELDRVGARLWQLLARSPAACKILCVDALPASSNPPCPTATPSRRPHAAALSP